MALTEMMRAPAVFLDKDGTLIRDIPYNRDPSLIEWMPGVPDGLRALHHLGYKLIVVTNQGGIAHGLLSEQDIERTADTLQVRAVQAGAQFDGFYYCPHDITGSVEHYAVRCACRKPMPGLLLRAAAEQSVDLTRSWMIGDILNDVEAGRSAGVQTVLVDVGNETLWERGPQREPHHHVYTFSEAVEIIRERSQLT